MVITKSKTKVSFKPVEKLLSDLANHGECVIYPNDPKWIDKFIRIETALSKQDLEWVVSSTYDGDVWIFIDKQTSKYLRKNI